ncbi:MAG: aminotransferase class III-fold pyridoxal phosphate-dependent enzyme [Phycisphaera sp.]|nr:MAG: aminotransferase class III-fold pyridoxal phosphate-dependent enzyme [Phycisphaera sp.]
MTPTTQTQTANDTTTRTPLAEGLAGHALATDPAIAGAIDTLVERVAAHSAAITDVRPPRDGAAASFDELVAKAEGMKGRPLLYKYIGSGVGNGALVELADGSVKWDMIIGIGVHMFGHSHPELIRAAARASVEDVAKSGNLMTNPKAYQFGDKLVELAKRNSRLSEAFITTSGAVANESALKICYQKHAPASRVLAFKHCFMGRTVTMAQIGDSAGGRQGIPLTTQVDYMPFWNEQAAEEVGGTTRFIDHCVWRLQQFIDRYPKQYACFIFELVQGEGGFNTAPREFFTALMDVCKANDIAVWDDEIQSFGRTRQMFAYETYDLGDYVDVFCVGKMTQACATLWTEDYKPKPGLLSGTFTGSATDFAVGTRMLEMLDAGRGGTPYYGDDGLIVKHHAAFREQVEALIAKHPSWFPPALFCKELVGGEGGMMRFTPFGGDQKKVIAACKACFEEGVVLFWCGHGPYHVRMLPPLGVMKLEDWPRVFEVVERALAKVAG